MSETGLKRVRENNKMNIPPTFVRATIALLLTAPPIALAGSTRKTQEWIDILKSDSSLSDKARACQRLGEFGNAEAVPALASLLSHNILSTYARAGLERIPGPEASAALRDALDQTQGKLLIGVINSIAALRDEKAVPALSALTRNSDPRVVKAALLALGRISNEQAIAVIRRALTSGPERFRPDAAAACLLSAQNQLDDGKAGVAQELYDAVRKAQVPASYRIGATRGSILARESDRVRFLVRQLHSDEAEIRNVALLTIREIPSDELAAALNTELENSQGDLQIKLLTALKDCHNAQSPEIIKKKIRSNDPDVRMTALRVLAEIGGSDDAPTFLSVISDHPGDGELSIATGSLERLQGAEVDKLILKAIKSSEESEASVRLIDLLSKRNATSANGELLRQAASSDRQVRIAAFQALKSLAGLDELPRLIALTRKCRDDSVRDAAINAVYGACKNSERSDRAGALVLEQLKTSAATADKEAWIRILAMLGYAEALPVITATLQDTDQRLVQDTISHLSRWPNPRPIEALFNVVEGDSNSTLRRHALAAVLKLATDAADRDLATDEELIVWFKRANKAVQSVQEKRLLLSGLGRVKHIESVRLSASYLDDADVKTEAAYAMVNAAEPLVKGPDYEAVKAVLKRISGVRDQRLHKRMADLKREIKSTETRLNK
jgi:HEAT repeat protein